MRWAKKATVEEFKPSDGDFMRLPRDFYRLPRDPTRTLKLKTTQDTRVSILGDGRGVLCIEWLWEDVDSGATTENFSNFQMAVSHEVFSK